MKYNKQPITLGDWCKWLEKNFSPEIMIPTLPVIIRLDGNNFHNFVKGLKKPWDDDLMKVMKETTKELVKETNAIIGYTQSDEITLILFSPNRKSKIYHEGKKQKILSKLTGFCVNTFNHYMKVYIPNHNKIANFDCRIYQTPTLEDATLQLLWRENDAVKNSISMLAQSLFSHNELQKLNDNQLQDKIFKEKNINWNDLPADKKRGTYIKRDKIEALYSTEEIDKLPKNHNARKNNNLKIVRSVISEIDLPILNTIKNKVDVIFNNKNIEYYE